MRITPEQKISILESIEKILGTDYGKVLLYGSRVDDTLKGGDIDLVIQVEEAAQKEQFISKLSFIQAEMKKRLGDRKIDVSVISENDSINDPFWVSALKRSIVLQ